MTVTISRLYNNYSDARVAVQALEAAGVKHGDISVLASNADDRFAAVETFRLSQPEACNRRKAADKASLEQKIR
jgi:hypothetical protein